VILLNNDVVCHGPFVSRMVASASGGISGARSRYEPDLAATVLEGWCLCFSRLLFDELGGFDDSMRLYFSDTDFQKRATTAGHPLNVAAVSLGHIGHQTAHNHRLSPDQPRLWREDRIAFLNKHGMVSR
jgi:GT2 family glycosyltransferase